MLRQMNVKDDYNDAQTTQKNRRYMHGMMYLLLFLFCLGFLYCKYDNKWTVSIWKP